MSSFLRALSKIGLVELDESDIRKSEQKRAAAASDAPASEDDIERILRETQAAIEATGAPSEPAPAPAPASAPPPSPAPTFTATAPISEGGRPLTDIYLSAGVTDSPFPVEKLLKLLEGLQALPPASRKAAVLALDAADDNWSIADVILDAQRKSRALREEQARLAEQLSASEAKARADLAATDEYQEQATATIRQQIAELEALLQQEVQQVAEQKSSIQADLQTARDTITRQRALLDAEINRLGQIPVTFSDTSL